MSYFNCFDCRKATHIRDSLIDRCPLCQGCNGSAIDSTQFKEGMDAGFFFYIEPSTGKRLKKTRK